MWEAGKETEEEAEGMEVDKVADKQGGGIEGGKKVGGGRVGGRERGRQGKGEEGGLLTGPEVEEITATPLASLSHSHTFFLALSIPTPLSTKLLIFPHCFYLNVSTISFSLYLSLSFSFSQTHKHIQRERETGGREEQQQGQQGDKISVGGAR